MEHRYKKAREYRSLTMVELAEKIGVHSSTIANWESGRRQITPDKLILLSKILDVSADYLLGIDCPDFSQTEPLKREALLVLHEQPIWSAKYGWMLINVMERTFVLADRSVVPFDEVQEALFLVPPAFSLSSRGIGKPLAHDEIFRCNKVWVEPITTDTKLAGEMRGWYSPHNQRLVQNEFGNRFYIDNYGSKWLAFENCDIKK